MASINEIQTLAQSGKLVRGTMRARGFFEPVASVMFEAVDASGQSHRVVGFCYEDANGPDRVYIRSEQCAYLSLKDVYLVVNEKLTISARSKKKPRGRGFRRGYTPWNKRTRK